jgi:ketosteroid isomerase-like protein
MEASSQERNVELVHRGLDAYNRQDFEAVVELLDEDVEVYTAPGLINSATYQGHDGWRRWIAQWDEAWDQFRIRVEDVEPVGGRHVVVAVTQFGRGAGSGIEVEMSAVQLYEFGDRGKVTRFHLYPDRQAALMAVERLRTPTG